MTFQPAAESARVCWVRWWHSGLLFPVFLIGGMGQGDVKMQTGFGAWVAALYGSHEGLWTIVYAVCAGYIVGGILGSP